MMFKAIYMHTKPSKHTKKHANTNELHQKTRFPKMSYKSQLLEALFKNSRSHNLQK